MSSLAMKALPSTPTPRRSGVFQGYSAWRMQNSSLHSSSPVRRCSWTAVDCEAIPPVGRSWRPKASRRAPALPLTCHEAFPAREKPLVHTAALLSLWIPAHPPLARPGLAPLAYNQGRDQDRARTKRARQCMPSQEGTREVVGPEEPFPVQSAVL